ncbi:MAG TPA: TolC family protein [Bacteroidota bacterium]|nr:TolC family protein [Bacteroidota bacterium]
MKRIYFSMGMSVVLYCAVSSAQGIERLSIHDAITIALMSNPQSLVSSRQIDAERGRFWRGIAPPAPVLGVNCQYIPKGSTISRFGERTVEISQTLEFPTTMVFRGMQLDARIAAAEAEHAQSQTMLASQVKIAYYTVLAKTKKIGLSGENLFIAEDFARKADVRYNVGEATNLERLTAGVQRTQAVNALEGAKNDLKISLDELNYALGRANTEREIVLTDSLYYEPVDETESKLLELALASNPQIQAAQSRNEAASLERTLAWSSVLPGVSASYYRQTVDGNPNFYGVSFGISLPLWFMFDQRGRIEEASAALHIAEAEMQSLKNSIGVNVKSAFLEMKNFERQILLQQREILPQAEEVYRSALAGYEAGELTYIEFLQARQLLISSRADHIDELVRYRTSIVKLEYAVGTALTHQ